MEIVFGYYGGNVEANLNKENEKWLDMDGTKTVWLRILYNQKNTPAITHLKFMYMPFEGDHLVLTSEDYFLFSMFKKKLKSILSLIESSMQIGLYTCSNQKNGRRKHRTQIRRR